MNAKEKAKELVVKFEIWTSISIASGFCRYDAKQCDLIDVEEMIALGLLDRNKLQLGIDINSPRYE